MYNKQDVQYEDEEVRGITDRGKHEEEKGNEDLKAVCRRVLKTYSINAIALRR